MAEFSEDHKAKVRANGAKGGFPPGQVRPPLTPPTPERTQAAIDHLALCVMEGNSPYNARPLTAPISDNDRKQLTRFAGITADAFTQRLTDRLRALADLTADRIQQKLSEDKFKPHELSFLLTVAVDKLQRVEGRGLIQGAQVNVQINNFGPESKESIIARLTGQALDVSPSSSPPYPEPVTQAPIVLTDDPSPYGHNSA